MGKSQNPKPSQEQEIEQHGIALSVFLHLWPGLLFSVIYLLIAGPMDRAGYPTMLALAIAYIFIFPAELGFLYYLGKKRNGSFSLEGIVLYRQKMPLWQYFVLIPLLVFASGIIFTILTPLSDFLFDKGFSSWLPVWVLQDPAGQTYSQSVLWLTAIVTGVFIVVVYPIIEELYFRGYLLPRISRLREVGIILNSLLFGVYHFLLPWSLIARFLALLPPLYFVHRTKNIYFIMWIHCIGNMAALGAIVELMI